MTNSFFFFLCLSVGREESGEMIRYHLFSLTVGGFWKQKKGHLPKRSSFMTSQSSFFRPNKKKQVVKCFIANLRCSQKGPLTF